MDRLFDNLKGSHGSYILPLFWQHGESEEIIREEIALSLIHIFCAHFFFVILKQKRPQPKQAHKHAYPDYSLANPLRTAASGQKP